MDESSLKDDKIQCPWHQATFNPSTGAYLGQADGQNFNLNGLTLVNLKIENENIYAA